MTIRNRRGLIVLGALLLVMTIMGLRGAWNTPGKRYVVVHSDDAGLCPAVNRAVIEAMEHGSVSSTSIMVPCPGFEDFAAYARSHPDHDYGVHLTLTSEMHDFRWGPVLPVHSVPSLVREDGTFWNSSHEVGEHAVVEEAERELRAQIDRALELGVPLTHLDHHMFCLFSHPELMKLYIRLGREYDLPVRMQKEPHPDDVNLNNEELVRTYYGAIEDLFSRREPVFEMCEADNYGVPAEDKRAYFLDVLRNLKPGVSEILLHCAYECDPPMRVPAPTRREADTRVFSSLEVAEELDRLGIQLIDWKEFRALRRQQPFGM